MPNDFEIDDCPCPACGNPTTHSQDCFECDEANEVSVCCDDLCQEHCIHGDGMVACPKCNGTGIQRWCPKCGVDYWEAESQKARTA